MIKSFASVLLSTIAVCLSAQLQAQCCAGGSGSCIIGGAAQGVLQHGQVELNTNFQFISTTAFYKQDQAATEHTFDSYRSQYEYFKLAYGATKDLTVSLESGYFLLEEVGLENNPSTTYTSKGIGDLVIYPRYDVYRKEGAKSSNEITIGLGYKIPLGSYNDSVGNVEPFSGQIYYVTKPTNVQLSSGAQDVIFFTSLNHGFLRSKLSLFLNGMYIKTGWNPNGEKLGDFASLALFARRSFQEHYGITLQVRYETVARMQINEAVLLYGRPSNYYPKATGYRKLFFTPQLSINKDRFTIYAATDLPLYQYMNTSDHYTQVGSQFTTTVGLSYRFFVPKRGLPRVAGKYYCPMHPEEVSDEPGKCSKCLMDLEKAN